MTERNRGAGNWSLRGPEVIGVLLIVVGGLYFLGNTGILRFSWNLIWPILVIGIGVAVLLSARRPAGTGSASAHVPRDGIQQLELDFVAGGGKFRLTGGSSDLVDVTSNRDDIVLKVDRSGQRSRVRLRQDANWFAGRNRLFPEWTVTLAADVATALSVQGGAGSFDVDLSSLRIVDARFTLGAADVKLALPRPQGEVRVRVSTGAASVTIQVPAGVEAQVAGSGGLLQIDGRRETPGYAGAADRVSVTVTGGASSVRVV